MTSQYFLTQVLCIKRRVIAVGWERDICVFRDKQLMSSDFNITPDEWSGRREHSEDIMCAVYHAPGRGGYLWVCYMRCNLWCFLQSWKSGRKFEKCTHQKFRGVRVYKLRGKISLKTTICCHRGLNQRSWSILCQIYIFFLSLLISQSGYLATASANGEIVLWNPNSENKIMKLDSRSSQAMKTQVLIICSYS
jgi:hypothetical protein